MGGTCGKENLATHTVADTGALTNLKLEKEDCSYLVGEISNIKDDKFTEVKITETKSVLVARHGKEFYAVGDRCPHAGAQLINGVVSNGKIRCPWHAACFDLKTGDLEDFPGFDCIPSYKVKVVKSNVYVQVNPKEMVDRVQKPLKKMCQRDQKVVIIGSGPCGYSCAQTLREEGYPGRIVMVTKDKYLPYDRTKLTKKLGCAFDDIKIRSETFYQDNDIEVILNTVVGRVDAESRSIYFEGSSNPNLSYDSLFIAVGMTPRLYSPAITGDHLRNIYTLHSLEQCMRITEVARDMEVVLIGSSFISMELAELLSPFAAKIHIISRSKVPYGLVFGNTIGEVLLSHFSNKLPNVTFHSCTEVKNFVGNNLREVSGVLITNNVSLNCQLVVIAIGGTPNTQFLQDSGIQLYRNTNCVQVDQYLETNYAGVFAGGDAINFPIRLGPNERGTVAHWQLASQHGRVAALNILRRRVNILNVVPFFWTNVCGLQVRYTGYGEGYDETLLYGNIDKFSFCTVYRRNQRLVAVCCVGCDKLAAELAMLFQANMDLIVDVPEPIIKRFSHPPTSEKFIHG